MNKLIGLVLVVAAAGVSFAGEMEKSAVSADLLNIDITTAKQVIVPVPAMGTVKAAVSASFKQAVKTEYERLTGYNDVNAGVYTLDRLPIAKVSELPAAAKKQLKEDNALFGPEYTSTPYKMNVKGKIVYVIHNENEGGMFVNIFDAAGTRLASGGCSESGSFGWGGDKLASADKNGGLGHAYQDMGWRHNKLQAANGTKVDVDYNVYSVTSYTMLAAPVWINVSNPAFTGRENISVVLTNYYANPAAGGIESTRTIILKSVGAGKFTAEAGHNPISLKGYATTYRQELSVVVDGNWLTDPISGTHNFKLTMGQ